MGSVELELRMKDVSLLSISVSQGPLGDEEARVVDVAEGKAHLMPWGLEPTGEGVLRWMASRALPQNRRFAETLCAAMGISAGDVAGIYEVSMGLSLNDSYWTPPLGSDVKFADVNLFENGFSEVLSAVAYAGGWDRSSTLRGMTPELTTNGSLAKAWRVAPDGSRNLWKGATPGWDPGEPLGELIAWKLAEAAGMSAVRYSLDEWDGALCSVCRDFCSTDKSYVPFGMASPTRSMLSLVEVASSLGPTALDAALDMLCLDALICNDDRHFGNLGLVRDNDSGAAVGMAPIFDCGRGLLPMVGDDDLGAWEGQVAIMRPAFGGGSFDQLASHVIGERQHDRLGRVRGLDLAEAIAEDVPVSRRDALVARARALQPFLEARLHALLSMSPVDPRDLVSVAARERERLGRKGDAAYRYMPASSLAVPRRYLHGRARTGGSRFSL